MKRIISVLLTALMFVSTLAFAHEEHGSISGYQATRIAVKVTQKLTFKDLGYAVGKLDKSWKDIAVESFKLEGVEQDHFVVSSLNVSTDESLYFLIARNGQVVKVNDSRKF